MENENKLTFWKKLKFSIMDFEKYQDLAAEKILKTVAYISVLTLLFALITAGIGTYKFITTIGKVRQYIDSNIETITFGDNILNVIPKSNEKITKIQDESMGIKVIINTQLDEEEINKSIDEIKSEDNGILILKDKILIKNQLMKNPFEYSYKYIAEQYNINKLDKQETINLLSSDEIKLLVFMLFGVILIYMFIMDLSSTLVDIVILSIFGYVVSLITRLRLKYSALYNIAAYSLTLPIILNIIYLVINSLTGFTIKYFEVMYSTVATIYITTAIVLIRYDVIKKQMELSKIIEEQDRVRAELQRREEEKKEQEEKERQKREDEKNRKKKEKKDDEGKIGQEPEGDNA